MTRKCDVLALVLNLVQCFRHLRTLTKRRQIATASMEVGCYRGNKTPAHGSTCPDVHTSKGLLYRTSCQLFKPLADCIAPTFNSEGARVSCRTKRTATGVNWFATKLGGVRFNHRVRGECLLEEGPCAKEASSCRNGNFKLRIKLTFGTGKWVGFK